jgi:hypothetical protein
LLNIEFPWAPEPPAVLLGSDPASRRAFLNQFPFQLCDAGKHRHDHFTRVGGRIGSGFRE